jgi:hypothetical protein
MRRAFRAPPENERCQADITLRDGSGALCMRRATIGNPPAYCWQHARLMEAKTPSEQGV